MNLYEFDTQVLVLVSLFIEDKLCSVSILMVCQGPGVCHRSATIGVNITVETQIVGPDKAQYPTSTRLVDSPNRGTSHIHLWYC